MIELPSQPYGTQHTTFPYGCNGQVPRSLKLVKQGDSERIETFGWVMVSQDPMRRRQPLKVKITGGAAGSSEYLAQIVIRLVFVLKGKRGSTPVTLFNFEGKLQIDGGCVAIHNDSSSKHESMPGLLPCTPGRGAATDSPRMSNSPIDNHSHLQHSVELFDYVC